MGESDAHCVFCKIISGEVPSEKILEDEYVVAFWDANPVAAIHILIVPREHIPTLNDVPEDNNILSHIGQAARRVAERFGVDQSGYRLFINVNRGGGQVIFHLHAHLISKNTPAQK
jgi:histidine triad (HIT) family protein